MSFDNDPGDYYAFDGMLCNYDNITIDDDIEQSEINKKKELSKLLNEKLKLTKLVSGFETNEEIRDYVITFLIKKSEDYMVKRYAKREKLPQDFVLASRQQNGLAILIKTTLKKIANIELNTTITDKIDTLLKELYKTDTQKIVYWRVNKIQKFIHDTTNDQHGIDAAFELPIVPMKNFLSACRLHLNLHDMKNRSVGFSIYQNKSIVVAIRKEEKKGIEIEVLPNGKKYIPYWKIRQLRPLMAFNRYEFRKLYKNLVREISLHLKRDSYIDRVVECVFEIEEVKKLIFKNLE